MSHQPGAAEKASRGAGGGQPAGVPADRPRHPQESPAAGWKSAFLNPGLSSLGRGVGTSGSQRGVLPRLSCRGEDGMGCTDGGSIGRGGGRLGGMAGGQQGNKILGCMCPPGKSKSSEILFSPLQRPNSWESRTCPGCVGVGVEMSPRPRCPALAFSPPRSALALGARRAPAPCGTLPGAGVLRVRRGRVGWRLLSHLLRLISS